MTAGSEANRHGSLNDAQRRAVTATASTVAILAGPGSGKTHTLTSRVVWLVQQAGLQPANIVVATFTVKAAREMRERIGKTLGEQIEKKVVLGTFHSISRRYLAAYGKRIGLDPKFGIADDGDSKAIIGRIIKRLDLNIEPQHAKSWISKQKAAGTGLTNSQPSQTKGYRENPALRECYQEYQDQLSRSNLLDYDDLLVRCVQLLREHPSCVSNVQAVLIDEYQDTNGIQYELMRLFSQARERITIVGDPDQSIYGWRSAEIKNLNRFLRDYPQTVKVSLEENYRSSQSILDVSLQVIQQDQKRYPKVLLPVHTKGARPVLRSLKSAFTEGEWIVTEIKRVIMMLGGMIRREDVAILLRSATLSRHIESALGKAGIPYRMIGGNKFYDRKEIKILLDYLRVVYQPDNNDAVARVINVPRRGIGETTIKALLEEAEKARLSLWAILRKHCQGERKATTKIQTRMEQNLNSGFLRTILMLQRKASDITESSPLTLVDLIEQLIASLDFQKYLQTEYSEDHEGRWANVQELLNMARDFMRDLTSGEEEELPDIEDLDQVKEVSVMGRFLANIALASNAQKDEEDENKTSVVTISTIHAAKGLEWPVVFVPAVYTGSIPHARAEDLDEERRLLYVAMTRAKSLLYLSCPMFGSQGNGKVELSPFVEPISNTAFARKGPSFDRKLIESIGKILGTDVPCEKTIFDSLPNMFSTEDDLFPTDPNEQNEANGYNNDRAKDPRPMKRQRPNMNKYSGENEDDPLWGREYSTTMESSHTFSVATRDGFTTASAHQCALDEAAKKAVAQQLAMPPKSGIKRGSTARGQGQRSILNFTTKTSMTNTTMGLAEGSGQHHGLETRKVAEPPSASEQPLGRPGLHAVGIEAKLAQHKVVRGTPVARPAQAGKSGQHKQYACFPSSPPRSPPSGEGLDDTKKERGESAQIVPNRPMTSFHSTSFQSIKANTGVRRPVGLGPAPTMDRLRRPFKPLTIVRPRGPT